MEISGGISGRGLGKVSVGDHHDLLLRWIGRSSRPITQYCLLRPLWPELVRAASPRWHLDAGRGTGARLDPPGAPRPDQRSCCASGVLVEVVAQRLGPGGVSELGHSLVLDLPDALASDPVDAADLIERPWLAVGEPESQADDPGFPVGQRSQYRLQVVLQQ